MTIKVDKTHLTDTEYVKWSAVECPYLKPLGTKRFYDDCMPRPCEVCHGIVAPNLVGKALVVVGDMVQVPNGLPRLCHI